MFKPSTSDTSENESPKEDKPDEMPPYEKWKDAFEKLLVYLHYNVQHLLIPKLDLELPNEKREQMNNLPLESKYKLLTSYKSNTLVLLFPYFVYNYI